MPDYGLPRIWGVHDAQATNDPRPSGCGYYRIVLPFDQLNKNGWDACYRAGQPPPEADSAKIIVGERFDRPEVMGSWRRLALRHKLVYEIDDDVFNVDILNWMAYGVYSRAATQDAVTHCAAVSHLVTVTVEPLAELMRPYNPNVAVIPNFVPESILDIERPRRPELTIGWAGGASHARDMNMIAVPLRRFLSDDQPGTMLHLIGTDFRPTVGMVNTKFTTWEADPRDYYGHIDFDIGLAPLTGHRFNASKSSIKALEYAALGIPCIASDSEPYRDFIIDGVTGFLVRSKAQWRDRLNVLATDEVLRENMGAKAKEVARQHTIEGNWWRWDQVYRGLL